MEKVTDFIFGGFIITVDGDCSHGIKRCLPLGRKAMTNLVSILKSRDITLQTEVCLVKVMVFPVVMYGCESWTIKKAEHQRIDAFELLVLGQTLESPLSSLPGFVRKAGLHFTLPSFPFSKESAQPSLW